MLLTTTRSFPIFHFCPQTVKPAYYPFLQTDEHRQTNRTIELQQMYLLMKYPQNSFARINLLKWVLVCLYTLALSPQQSWVALTKGQQGQLPQAPQWGVPNHPLPLQRGQQAWGQWPLISTLSSRTAMVPASWDEGHPLFGL